MASKIRWRDTDRKKLATYVRKFNASITREGKKSPELLDAGILPQKLDIKQIEKGIYSRKDYNVIISRIDRWFKPKAREVVTLPNGVKTTSWNKKEIQYAVQRQKAQKKARIKAAGYSGEAAADIEKTFGDPNKKMKELFGRKEKMEKQSDGKLDWNDVFDNELQLWNNFVKKVFTQSTDEYLRGMNERYHDNFLSAIERNFTKEHADALKQSIKNKKLDGEILFYMTSTNPNISFEYVYSEEDEIEKFDLIMQSIENEYIKLQEKAGIKTQPKKQKRRKRKK